MWCCNYVKQPSELVKSNLHVTRVIAVAVNRLEINVASVYYGKGKSRRYLRATDPSANLDLIWSDRGALTGELFSIFSRSRRRWKIPRANFAAYKRINVHEDLAIRSFPCKEKTAGGWQKERRIRGNFSGIHLYQWILASARARARANGLSLICILRANRASRHPRFTSTSYELFSNQISPALTDASTTMARKGGRVVGRFYDDFSILRWLRERTIRQDCGDPV